MTDPTTDPIGTIRREDHDGGYSIWQRHGPHASVGNEWTCVWSTAWGNIKCTLPHWGVRDFPVIGAVPGTPAATTQDHRVAYDNDGAPWDEIETGVFKYRSDDGDGDELSLAQLDECYGLAALSPAPGNEPRPDRERDLLTGLTHEFDPDNLGPDHPHVAACTCGWFYRHDGENVTVFLTQDDARRAWDAHATVERAASAAQEGGDRG